MPTFLNNRDIVPKTNNNAPTNINLFAFSFLLKSTNLK